MNKISHDVNIPVLTEILIPASLREEQAAAESGTALSAAPVAAPTVQLPPPSAPTVEQPEAFGAGTEALEAQAAAGWTEEEWGRLERKVRERILRQVLGRIDFVLEQRVRDSLADVLQMAVENIAIEIKRGLHQTLSEVISRAVTQEIARLQAQKK